MRYIKLTILLICALFAQAQSQTTYTASKFKQVWYVATTEKTHGTFALYDTSSFKIDVDTNVPILTQLSATGTTLFQLDKTGAFAYYAGSATLPWLLKTNFDDSLNNAHTLTGVIRFTQDIIPTTNGGADIGQTSLRYDSVKAATGDFSGNVFGSTYGSDATVSNAELLYINSLTSNAQDQFNLKLFMTAFDDSLNNNHTITGLNRWTNDLIPTTNGGADLGQTSLAWDSLKVGTVDASANLKMVATTATTGQILQGSTLFIHNYGSDNIFAGIGAGNLTLTATKTTGFGSGVFTALTDAEENTGIGYRSLYSVTSGDYNTGCGSLTLTVLTTGIGNSAFGEHAGISLTEGLDNTLIGRGAGQNITTGDYNQAIGYYALQSNVEGNNIVAIGYNALYYATVSDLTAVGVSAGYKNSTGLANDYFGKNSGRENQTGTSNCGFGQGSLYNNIGSYNNAMGINSLNTQTSGTGMIAMGFQSGYGATPTNSPGTDTYGILIGYNANRSVVTATSLTNYIGIGYGTLIDKSNQVKIGNTSITETVLYGSVQFGGMATVGKLHGSGSSGLANAYSVGATAGNTKAMSYYIKSTSELATDVLEGLYVNTYHGTDATKAAPSGEAGRFRAYLTGDAAGTVALAGMHSTVEMATGSTNSGLTLGGRMNIVLPNEVVGGSGTYAGGQAELYTGGSSTSLAGITNASIMQLNISGTAPTNAAQLSGVSVFDINVPANLVGDGLVIDDAASNNAVGGKIRVKINGTYYWLMYADADN